MRLPRALLPAVPAENHLPAVQAKNLRAVLHAVPAENRFLFKIDSISPVQSIHSLQ
jgi:hypothetical protein